MPRNAPVPQSGPFAVGAANQRDGIIIPAAEYANDGGPAADGIFYSQEYTNLGFKGVRLYIDLTNRHTTGTLVVKLQSKDPTSGNWADVPAATTASLTSVATTTLTIYPGIAETSNVDIADPLGLKWRVVATVGTAHVDFSVGGDYLI
jgi:hypothetical protein